MLVNTTPAPIVLPSDAKEALPLQENESERTPPASFSPKVQIRKDGGSVATMSSWIMHSVSRLAEALVGLVGPPVIDNPGHRYVYLGPR